MIKWKPFEFEGKVYDLKHLHPLDNEYIQDATKDKPAKIYNIKVLFSLHCFTRGKGSDENRALFYKDDRECRVFCIERYDLSKKLPEIINNIFDRKCYHTGHSNYFTVELIDRSGKQVEYQVYFTVSKCTKRKGYLNLYVQSAYPNTKNIRKKPKKPVRFRVIAYNTSSNKQTKPPP